jgi:hypothetical protein
MAAEVGGLITLEGMMPPSKAKMRRLPLTRILHENMATIVTFAFSYWPIRRLLDERFAGYWKYVEEFAFGVPERNATRACLEIAVLLRLIEEPPEYQKWSFGTIYHTDGTTTPLCLKERAKARAAYGAAAELDWCAEGRGPPAARGRCDSCRTCPQLRCR